MKAQNPIDFISRLFSANALSLRVLASKPGGVLFTFVFFFLAMIAVACFHYFNVNESAYTVLAALAPIALSITNAAKGGGPDPTSNSGG